MPRFDVVSLGELLIDFTQNGPGPQGNPQFEANPGGAPANVLAMLRKLGRSCAFIGKVGRDSFGTLLADTLQNAGIDTSCLIRGHEPTTLAVVHTLPGGDRDFSFYRRHTADVSLTPDEVDGALVQSCRIFHFGTLSLTDEPCRSATQKAVECAKNAGITVSFDPNWRPPLWKSDEDARQQMLWGLGQCDILKISDNEVTFLTGEEDPFAGGETLLRQFPQIRLMNVTCGADGSRAYYGEKRVFMPSCRLGGVIETTGAGDTFCGVVLHFVLEHGLENLTENDLAEMLRFANAAAYLVTTKKGALCSMPERSEVEKVLENPAAF